MEIIQRRSTRCLPVSQGGRCDRRGRFAAVLARLKGDMNMRFLRLTVIGLAAILASAACASKAATPPPVDDMATNVARGVSVALTQTAGAPTPLPSATPAPIIIPATATSGPIPPLTVTQFASCWFGPGSAYNLESNIEQGEKVELLGVGSVPGWYIILNPYFFQPCWIQAANLSIDASADLSYYPAMTPYPLRTPQP
jgi:uncharacterized protein YgiM (DUF1202 family)